MEWVAVKCSKTRTPHKRVESSQIFLSLISRFVTHFSSLLQFKLFFINKFLVI